MNRRTTGPSLLACAFALLAPRLALADFTGLQTVERTDLPICQDPSEPEIPYKLDVCSVYAVFNNPGDRLISVGFSDGSTTDANGFFQHAQGNAVYSPSCGGLPGEPTLVCDSFVTIGLECIPLLGGTRIDLDFDAVDFQSNGLVSGGWYNSSPSNGQGTPDVNGKVLIAQFSVKQNKDVTGTLTVFAKLAGADDVTEYSLQAFDCFGESAGGGGAPSGGGQGGSAPLGGPTVWYVDVDVMGGGCCSA
ncbi:MAG: hypothetical protein IIA66_11925, partial [Planctomycetes bacterium]|nr:hypothetical protein [Planctomycetota bacterium]